MAACKSLHHYFEKPMPENPTLIEALSSWNQIKHIKPVDLTTSFTELFGELHFKEKLPESPSSPIDQQCPLSKIPQNSVLCNSDPPENPKSEKPISENTSSFDFDQDFQSKNSPDHQNKKNSKNSMLGISNNHYMCTEGLGFESCDDLEDSKESGDDLGNQERGIVGVGDLKNDFRNKSVGGSKRSKIGDFPPPISCIGRNGQPWVCFKSYRGDGRFVLREMRAPGQEFLHASREDGRLKLHFIQRDETVEDEEDEEREQVRAREEQENH